MDQWNCQCDINSNAPDINSNAPWIQRTEWIGLLPENASFSPIKLLSSWGGPIWPCAGGGGGGDILERMLSGKSHTFMFNKLSPHQMTHLEIMLKNIHLVDYCLSFLCYWFFNFIDTTTVMNGMHKYSYYNHSYYIFLFAGWNSICGNQGSIESLL